MSAAWRPASRSASSGSVKRVVPDSWKKTSGVAWERHAGQPQAQAALAGHARQRPAVALNLAQPAVDHAPVEAQPDGCGLQQELKPVLC
ncbi:MAG: hypothetical protein WDO13_05330 [Verrucomicrobiota bacterium]